MRIVHKIIILLTAICIVASVHGADIADDRILSFEESTAPLTEGKGSTLSTSNEHYKHFDKSVKWNWDVAGAQISINSPIGYIAKNPDPNDTSVSTFVFWLYMPQPVKGTMRFEFRSRGKVCSWFDYGTDFQGWRGAWIAFERDMQGSPSEEMDELIITAPSAAGTAYLDHIILSSFQDVRQHTADFQAPYINPKTNSHWLVLLRSWNKQLDIPAQETITPVQQAGIDSITERLCRMLLEDKKVLSADELRKRFERFGISFNADGSPKGQPIQFVRYAETYITMGHNKVAAKYEADGRSLRQTCDLLFAMAVAYNLNTNAEQRQQIASMYVDLTRHLLDQGWAAGSAQGSLHHLGYSVRNFYTAPVLMRRVLENNGLLEAMQRASEWFSGVGEAKTAPTEAGMDIDAFNTSLIGRLSSIILLPDTPYKVAYLKAFSRWLNNGYQYTEGSAPCFKSDGTVFHHRHHYPAYAIGGFDGAVSAVWLLCKTPFAVSAQGHENLRKALLEMRFYCNLRSFPLAFSGRHPDGKGALIPWHYSLLAQSGTPDGKQQIDKELAAAYLRVAEPINKKTKSLFGDIEAEKSPTGNKVYGYNSSMSHRRGDWLATFAGHSRYVWSAEIYQGANHYGRYLTHGSMQILGNGKPIDSFGSGFRQQGWDWCHIPGTTAAVIPMHKLKADIRNVDTFSGYEEMLLSDETFAGGVSHKAENGVYAMKLHENDKYNGSLRARKSFFAFDNRIVVLGTGLENALPESKLHTTLFQNELKKSSDPITINGKHINTFPYNTLLEGRNVIVDNLGNGYFVDYGKTEIKRSTQNSLDEETDKPTSGDFATAWIDHGTTVKGGTYRYMTVVKPTDEEIKRYTSKVPYKVLEQSDRAHIVHDDATDITGYVLFEGGTVGKGEVVSVSMPSLVMTSGDKNRLVVSACDPDLRFYEGEADEKLDANGRRIERSIYSRSWINNPSRESKLDVVIKGRWQVASGSEHCTSAVSGANTILTFSCREAATRQVELIKIR